MMTNTSPQKLLGEKKPDGLCKVPTGDIAKTPYTLDYLWSIARGDARARAHPLSSDPSPQGMLRRSSGCADPAASQHEAMPPMQPLGQGTTPNSVTIMPGSGLPRQVSQSINHSPSVGMERARCGDRRRWPAADTMNRPPQVSHWISHLPTPGAG